MDQLVQEQEEVRALQEKSSALEEELKSAPGRFLAIFRPNHPMRFKSASIMCRRF